MSTVLEYKQCPPGPLEGSLTVPLCPCLASGQNLSLVVEVHNHSAAPSAPPHFPHSPCFMAYNFPSSKTKPAHPPADVTHLTHFFKFLHKAPCGLSLAQSLAYGADSGSGPSLPKGRVAAAELDTGNQGG